MNQINGRDPRWDGGGGGENPFLLRLPLSRSRGSCGSERLVPLSWTNPQVCKYLGSYWSICMHLHQIRSGVQIPADTHLLSVHSHPSLHSFLGLFFSPQPVGAADKDVLGGAVVRRRGTTDAGRRESRFKQQKPVGGSLNSSWNHLKWWILKCLKGSSGFQISWLPWQQTEQQVGQTLQTSEEFENISKPESVTFQVSSNSLTSALKYWSHFLEVRVLCLHDRRYILTVLWTKSYPSK